MFWAPCGSGGGGMGGWGWGVGGWGWGMPPTHMHMHMHACTCAHSKRDNFMQMAAPFGNPLDFPMMSYTQVRMCMHMHVHMCRGHPPHHPQPTSTHPHPPGGYPRISQNSIALELIKIFSILFEDLKSVETSPPMGGCMIWWVSGWEGGLMGGVRSKH